MPCILVTGVQNTLQHSRLIDGWPMHGETDGCPNGVPSWRLRATAMATWGACFPQLRRRRADVEAGEWSVNQQLVDDMVDCQPSGKETNNGKGMGAGQPTLVWLRWFLRISWDFVNVDAREAILLDPPSRLVLKGGMRRAIYVSVGKGLLLVNHHGFGFVLLRCVPIEVFFHVCSKEGPLQEAQKSTPFKVGFPWPRSWFSGKKWNSMVHRPSTVPIGL